MTVLEEMEAAYLEASAGDARDALRRAFADALAEIEAVSRPVSRGYARRAVGGVALSPSTAVEAPAKKRATG